MMRWISRGALVLVALGACAVMAKPPKPAKPLFADSALIQLTIKAPMAKLTQGSASPETSVAGTLSVSGTVSETVSGAAPETLAITLNPRGVKRRQRDVCPFPPLYLRFLAKPGTGSVFRGQNRLKLVTHCRPGTNFQQYVLLEYAAYRLFNVVTPTSFGARLAMIDYADADGRPITRRLGFFIEDVDDVAKRNGLAALKGQNSVRVAQLDPQAAVRFALFQTMIGNLDWAMNAGPAGSDCCHNAKLAGPKAATEGLVPVPYDFDYAGLVDAPYAVPPDKIPVANVRVRRYRGFCRHNALVAAEAAALMAKRAQLLAVPEAVAPLEARTRQKAADYLEGFFALIDSPAAIETKLLKTCV